MEGTNLDGVLLEGVDLTGANLTGANLDYTILDNNREILDTESELESLATTESESEPRPIGGKRKTRKARKNRKTRSKRQRGGVKNSKKKIRK